MAEDRVEVEFGASTGELDDAFSHLSEEGRAVGDNINRGVSQAVSGLNSLGATTSKLASQYSGLNSVVSSNSAGLKQTTSQVNALLDRYDPLGAKLKELQEDFRKLDAAATSGKIQAVDDARVDQAYARIQREIAATNAAMGSYVTSTGAATRSAGQLRMANQQLPMQFTDIWVSLAAGQNPMMVLIQQGSQIKDSFGGVTAAARAMSGYILGLINPITLVAAAAIAGVVAWIKWGDAAKEAAEKAKAAAATAEEAAQRAESGIHKTAEEQVTALENRLHGVTGQLEAAIRRRDAITRKTSQEEAMSIGAEVVARRRELAAIERQISEIKDSESKKHDERGVSYKTERAPELADTNAELALLREYLREAQEIYNAAYAHGEISTEEFYDARLAIEQAGIDASIKAKQHELDTLLTIKPKNQGDELKIKRDEIAISGQLNVLEAQRNDLVRKRGEDYRTASDRELAAMQKVLAQQELTSAQAGIARESAANQQRFAMRQITADQLFEMQKQEEQKSLAATQQFLLEKLNAEFESSGDKMKLMQEYAAAMEAAELKHQQKLNEINNKAALERAKYAIQAQTAVQNNMSTMFEDMIKGTKSLSDAFKDFAASVIADIIRIQAQRMAANIMGVSTSGGGGGGNTLGAAIGNWLGGSFAVGTNYVPNDMLAMVHKGERIVPASQNNPAMLGGLGQSNTVVNNFTVAGNVDTRTQAQIATLAGLAVNRALARNG